MEEAIFERWQMAPEEAAAELYNKICTFTTHSKIRPTDLERSKPSINLSALRIVVS